MKNIPPILRDLPEEWIGPRIVLRPRGPGDAEAIWEAVEESREQARQWLPWVDQTISIEDCVASGRRGLANWITREDLGVCLYDRETGRYLGGSGLHRINWEIPAFEIGYWLRTSAQGYGYVTEAVQILAGFVFDNFDAQRVFIRCDSLNTRSAAVPRRLGFIQEATLRNECRDNDGELRDTLVFALTADDYKRVKPLWTKAAAYKASPPQSLEEGS